MVGGTQTTDARRPRVARGRPNWWVILAVSLALMALLVATSGNPKRESGGSHGLASAQSNAAAREKTRAPGAGAPSVAASTARSTTTTTLAPPQTAAPALTATHSGTVPTTTAPPAPAPAPAPVTTTTTTTTATTAISSEAVGAGSHTGVIEPPAQRSSSVGFTGTGAMQVSVVWSGSTYLTLQVSCPNDTQNVGGSSAMAASVPDASGSCLATVSEPASESTALTYTITIEPAGG